MKIRPGGAIDFLSPGALVRRLGPGRLPVPQGVRAPVVSYNRANEAAAQLKPGDFDWRAIFAAGVRWFHSGGSFASLSATTGELIPEGMKAARDAGAVTSFDLNFREKLWNIWGGETKAPRSSAAWWRTSTSSPAMRRTCRGGSANRGPQWAPAPNSIRPQRGSAISPRLRGASGIPSP